VAVVATVIFYLILWGSSPTGFRGWNPLEFQKVQSALGALRGPGVGWNLLEPSGVPEDSAGGFGVRNHTYRVPGTGYSVARKLTVGKDADSVRVVLGEAADNRDGLGAGAADDKDGGFGFGHGEELEMWCC